MVMAKRRVFRTRAKCPGISTGPIPNQRQMAGQTVTLAKASNSEVNIALDGAVVGQLDAVVGNQVALALERGQAFTATIENVRPIYNDKFKPIGAHLDIKVEYLLEKGQPAIEAPTAWRAIEATPESSRKSSSAVTSFFTKVAGVTFEGRQRAVARCSEGERLTLIRDPNNPHDNGAIKVVRLNGQELGYIPAHVSRGGDSSGLAHGMDRGDKYQCRISALTGEGTGVLGVNIEIIPMMADNEAPNGAFAYSEKCNAAMPTVTARTTEAQSNVSASVHELRDSVHVSKSASATNARALLLFLAIIVIGFLLWDAFK